MLVQLTSSIQCNPGSHSSRLCCPSLLVDSAGLVTLHKQVITVLRMRPRTRWKILLITAKREPRASLSLAASCTQTTYPLESAFPVQRISTPYELWKKTTLVSVRSEQVEIYLLSAHARNGPLRVVQKLPLTTTFFVVSILQVLKEVAHTCLWLLLSGLWLACSSSSVSYWVTCYGDAENTSPSWTCSKNKNRKVRRYSPDQFLFQTLSCVIP